MLYGGKRRTVPASEYGTVLDVLEETGWTWQEWQAQPHTLCDELLVRFAKRAQQQHREANKSGKKR